MSVGRTAGSVDTDQVLKVRTVSKTFHRFPALDRVSLDLARGEIHGLVGGNGSGKSTLIKILAGVHRADPGGVIAAAGTEIAADEVTPAWSYDVGLNFVHQDLGQCEALSVAENLFVGLPYPTRRFGIHWRTLDREAAVVLEQLGVRVSPRQPLAELSPVDRTLVAVGRALHGSFERDDGVVVLDEPTACLPAREVARLLRFLRALAARGQAVVYVSHRLEEVLALADRITVLRDGRVVASCPAGELTYAELSSLVAGRAVSASSGRDEPPGRSEPLLAVRALRTGTLAGIDLDVARGEVVGLAGIAGSGRSTLLRAIFGATPRRGHVEVGGVALHRSSTAAAVRAGVGLVPEDRRGEAMFPGLDLRENLSAGDVWRFRRPHQRGRPTWLDLRRERSATEDAMARFDVRGAGADGTMATLSGGNQQKVVLARWLTTATHLLLLDEPTQGVDVGARADIHQHVRTAASRGLAVLLASSDTQELLDLCDRILVLRGGRLVAEAGRSQFDHRWLARHVYGNASEGAAA